MSTNLKTPPNCPNCGRPMPAGALAGLCPACLLAQGAETEDGKARGSGRFEPPSVSEIAPLFPQLEILNLIGAGGMGAVYKARQPALDRIVALKILPAKGASGANFEERFNREARALARLNHPNIVAVYEFGRTPAQTPDAIPQALSNLHFFIMEFVDGANLRLLEQGSRLSPREALQIIPQICDALQYAHDEGVVHRDIKPENVLIDRKGRVKIADFGLAKILGTDPDALRLTAEGQVMGTPHYMAPEQVEKPLAVDHRADIYALGVVFYEMLTGDLPLGKFAPPSRKYQLDVRFDDVVLRALENDPARRYQHASEVKSQVETIAGTPAPEVPPSTSPAADTNSIRWAGFPLVTVRDGKRHVNRKEAFKMFAIFFGLLTVAFGVVSLVHGENLFGWLGIAGAASLKLRLLIALLLAAWGVWAAWLAKPSTPSLPRTPQGTAILPVEQPERISRKAIIGAGLVPVFLLTVAMFFMSWTPTVVPNDTRPPGPSWWQVVLITLVGAGGIAAPFVTTILGWLAVGDIRRARGRIGGLPLAVFDGLFFPLLVLNAVLFTSLIYIIRQYASEVPGAVAESLKPEVVMLGVALLCAWVDFLIVRRVWRAVRLTGVDDPTPGEWWWATRRGGVNIALLCVLVIGLVASRRTSGPNSDFSVQQIAESDPQTGRLFANLPLRGKVELLAIGERDAASNGWWTADGTPLSNSLYEVHGAVDNVTGNRVPKQLILRELGLPEGASTVDIEAEPYSTSGAGGEVFLDGRRLPGARPVRLAWEASVKSATIRVGYALEPWRTIASDAAVQQPTSASRRPEDPRWQVTFPVRVPSLPDSANDDARVSVVFNPGGRLWTHRVVAVDTDEVEHPAHSTVNSLIRSSGETVMWNCEWSDLPMTQVREFRLQVRPVYWVEFREVALAPKAPLPDPVLRSERSGAFHLETAPTLSEQPPVVVETFPASGERGVVPGVRELRVRFSKPMAAGSWSWGEAWLGSSPELVGQPRFEPDGRTCIVRARLEPGRAYGFWLNSDSFKNFADRANRPAVPYLLIFETAEQ